MVGPYQLPILYIVVYICQPQSPNLSLPSSSFFEPVWSQIKNSGKSSRYCLIWARKTSPNLGIALWLFLSSLWRGRAISSPIQDVFFMSPVILWMWEETVNWGAEVWQVKHDLCVIQLSFPCWIRKHIQKQEAYGQHPINSLGGILISSGNGANIETMARSICQRAVLFSPPHSSVLPDSLSLETEESQLLRLESDFSTGFSFSSTGTFLISPSMAIFSAHDTKCSEKSLVFDVRVFNKETRAQCCVVCWCVCVDGCHVVGQGRLKAGWVVKEVKGWWITHSREPIKLPLGSPSYPTFPVSFSPLLSADD